MQLVRGCLKRACECNGNSDESAEMLTFAHRDHLLNCLEKQFVRLLASARTACASLVPLARTMLSSQARTTHLLFDEPTTVVDEPKQLVSTTDLVVRSTSSLISERLGALAKGSKCVVMTELDIVEFDGRRQRRALIATHHIQGEPMRLGWVTSYKAGSATLVPLQLPKPPVASPWRLAYSIFQREQVQTQSQAEAQSSSFTPATVDAMDGQLHSFTRSKSPPRIAARSHYTPSTYFPTGLGAGKPKLASTKIAWDRSETTSVAKRVVLELATPEQSRPTRPLSANAAILLRRKRTDTELDMS